MRIGTIENPPGIEPGTNVLLTIAVTIPARVLDSSSVLELMQWKK